MLKEKLKGYTLILASGSPRRQQFFKELDLNFEGDAVRGTVSLPDGVPGEFMWRKSRLPLKPGHQEINL